MSKSPKYKKPFWKHKKNSTQNIVLRGVPHEQLRSSMVRLLRGPLLCQLFLCEILFIYPFLCYSFCLLLRSILQISSHEVSMEFFMGFQWNFMEFLWNWHGNSMVLWDCYGISIKILCNVWQICMGFIWHVCRNSMAFHGFPWNSKGFPGILRDFYEVSMTCLCRFYGISVGFLRNWHGISRMFLWDRSGISKRFLSSFYRISMGFHEMSVIFRRDFCWISYLSLDVFWL